MFAAGSNDELSQSGAGGLEQGRIYEQERNEYHHDARAPGHHVEAQRIDMLAHQIAPIDQKKDENEHYRQPDSVGHLREDKNFQQRCVRKQDDARADNNEPRIQRIKRGSLPHLVIQTGFKTKTFTNDVSGGKRKDGSSEQGCVQKSESEQVRGPPSRHGPQRLRRLRRVADVRHPVGRR